MAPDGINACCRPRVAQRYGGTIMKLHLDDAELASCVGCGLCLPHCPTYRVTGEEGLSPRGRIAAMRTVAWEGAPVDDQFVGFMDTCVQCRGCEPACPSGVPYGRLIEGTKHSLAEAGRTTPWWQRTGFRVLGHHRLLLAGSTVLAVAQRLHLVPKRLGLGRLPVRRGPAVVASGERGGAAPWLFTGCVMDAWQRSTHRATQRVVESTGEACAVAGRGGDCCGALHVHAGLTGEAERLARRTIASMPGSAPVIVNSAGCGAAMKDYGRLLGTASARAFAKRVVDVHEWLAERLDAMPVADPTRPRPQVIVQDPCHLRHVQRSHLPVRAVLGRYADIVELDDDGLCCGAGGAYSALQPALAGQIRERKLEAIDRAKAASEATVVASANPGCSMHLAAAGATVRHPLDIVDELAGLTPRHS
jgi:glycolate oxidase iron-sulfur subunit